MKAQRTAKAPAPDYAGRLLAIEAKVKAIEAKVAELAAASDGVQEAPRGARERWDRLLEYWDALDAERLLEREVPLERRWMLDRLCRHMAEMDVLVESEFSREIVQ